MWNAANNHQLRDQPVLGGDTAGDLGTVGLVLHHQNLQLLHVVNKDLLEAAGHHVPGLGAATVTDVGHEVHPLELPPHSVVNTCKWGNIIYVDPTKQ